MNRDEFFAILSTDALFTDILPWQIKQVEQGSSVNKYRIKRDGHEFFVKEIQPHERSIWRLLSKMRLKHVPIVHSACLLDQMILVTDYISGGTLGSLDLDAGLVREMAMIQNHCSEESQRDNKARENWKSRALWCFDYAAANLQTLRRIAPSPELSTYERTFSTVAAQKSEFAEGYARMPFARLHHDLYPNNILAGPPQVIVDWGSSYGDGPFLYDLAPYLFLSHDNMKSFVDVSKYCVDVNPTTLQMWLVCATAVRFASFLKGIFKRGPEKTASEELWGAFLRLHMPLFAVLDVNAKGKNGGLAHGR
jgi:thiamine kinase-like enzyme